MTEKDALKRIFSRKGIDEGIDELA